MQYCLEELPSALLSCRCNQLECTIVRFCPDCITLRLPIDSLDITSLELSFYHSDTDTYSTFYVSEYEVTKRESHSYYHLFTVLIRDPRYQEEAGNLFLDYNRYCMQRLNGTLAEERLGYPSDVDDAYASTFEELRSTLMAPYARCSSPLPDCFELALSIDQPRHYAAFQELPFSTFYHSILSENHLTEHFLAGILPGRVYLGNAYCPHLLPENFSELLTRADEQSLQVSVVLPPITPDLEPRIQSLLTNLNGRQKSYEVICNDWGLLSRISTSFSSLTPVLGTLLNKHPKDPRLARIPARPNKNCLYDAEYRSTLEVHDWTMRFEFDGPPHALPEGKHSLHFPWYQTNTGMHCPLRAVAQTGDRNYQTWPASCSHPCMHAFLSYPLHLNMTGRYNSLFAFDPTLISGSIPEVLAQHCDRLVVDLL